MQVTYTYFLPLEGTVERGTPFKVTNPDFPPHRLAWCCPVCGEVWARAVPDNETPWIFLRAPCRKHKYYNEVPGGILARNPKKLEHSSMFWAQVIDFFPKDLLKRELEITLNFYENLQP